jgi:hypothetical protein
MISKTTSIRLLAISILSWLLGLAVYLTLLNFYFDQPIGKADLIAVTTWSLVAALIVFPAVHLPIMLLVRKVLGGYKPAIVFAVAASLVFLIPAIFIFWMFSTSFSNFILSLASSEAFLFYSMFIAAGVSFGFGFVWCFRKSAMS